MNSPKVIPLQPSSDSKLTEQEKLFLTKLARLIVISHLKKNDEVCSTVQEDQR